MLTAEHGTSLSAEKEKWDEQLIKTTQIWLSYSYAQALPSTYPINTPTFLHSDSGHILSYSAHVGGIGWELVFKVFQCHSVAMRLQLCNRAFAFELVFCHWSRHIGVNEGHFGSRGPRELIGADFVRLGLYLAVYSQVAIIFNAHGD